MYLCISRAALARLMRVCVCQRRAAATAATAHDVLTQNKTCWSECEHRGSSNSCASELLLLWTESANGHHRSEINIVMITYDRKGDTRVVSLLLYKFLETLFLFSPNPTLDFGSGLL